MPPRRATKAKKVTKAPKVAEPPTFTKAQAQELERLLKAQKEAEAAQEDGKKKASRKRSAANMQEEAELSQRERSTSPFSQPVSGARKIRRLASPVANKSQSKGTIGDLVGGIPKSSCSPSACYQAKLNNVADVLDHNASTDEELEELAEQPDAEESQAEDTSQEDEQLSVSSRKKKSVLEDQEVEIEDDTDSIDSLETRTTSSGSKQWKTKVTLSQFNTPRIRRIAQLGNRDMRRFGALEEAFPSATHKEDKCWEILTQVCKPHRNLNDRLKEVDGDLAMKDMLIIYAWQGLGSMRSELMLKARQRVPSWYNLTNLELGEDVISACQWLLQENRFLYAGINLQERTYDHTKPWMNPAIVHLIADQFWSMKGDAVRMGKPNNKYLDFPDALLAGIASSLQCALKGFSVSGKFRGAGSVIAFSDESFRSECTSYVNLLGHFSTKTPSFYKLMKMDMLDSLLKISSEAASMVTHSPTSMLVDMDALEENAKQLLAEREGS